MKRIAQETRETFTKRVESLGIPLERAIVIGSGVLELHGLRQANDVDLVVSEDVFLELEKSGWKQGTTGSSSYSLEKDEAEAWLDWSTDGTGRPNYDDLLLFSEMVHGIRAVTLDYLKQRKLERGLEKDLRDVETIENYQKGTK